VSWERERRFAKTPAAFGVHVGIDLGVLEVRNDAGAAELTDVGGNPQQHPPDATKVDHDVAALGVICFGAQVDHRRVLAELELLRPYGGPAAVMSKVGRHPPRRLRG